MTTEQQAREMLKGGSTRLVLTYTDGEKETVRAFVSTGDDVCKKAPRSRRHGYVIHFDTISKVEAVPGPRKSTEQQWRDGWMKAKARLEKSGLWGELVGDINTALELGYEALQDAHSMYHKDCSSDYTSLRAKYPALAMGDTGINITILHHIAHPAQIKKMRFRKHGNDEVLARIQRAMDHGAPCRIHDRYQYDVTFSLDSERKKAWYSEEFRGCGNGHYYLALDATHAIFYEND